MDESILNTVKKMLGLSSDYNAFDVDIIIDINAAFMTLMQLGVGPSEGFSIADSSATWSEFIGEDVKDLQALQSYVYLKVRTIFDPPTSGTLMDAINKLIAEYEWRLNIQVDKGGEENGQNKSGLSNALRSSGNEVGCAEEEAQ